MRKLLVVSWYGFGIFLAIPLIAFLLVSRYFGLHIKQEGKETENANPIKIN